MDETAWTPDFPVAHQEQYMPNPTHQITIAHGASGELAAHCTCGVALASEDEARDHIKEHWPS